MPAPMTITAAFIDLHHGLALAVAALVASMFASTALNVRTAMVSARPIAAAAATARLDTSASELGYWDAWADAAAR